jgi:hypothetical protein
MHQTSTQETRLWSFNTNTKNYEQLLSSRYNPVGVVLLPDKSGFSFLDNGLIKIKKFMKRSPKTIEIYEPLYNIGVPQWLDDTTCFFHAKEGSRFGLYQVDMNGQVSTIAKSTSYDYLYPQKVGNTLFFIARDLAGSYYVKKTDDYATQALMAQNVQTLNRCNVISLSMINENEGFIIEHAATNDTQLVFNVYRITMQEKKMIFSFYLSSAFFADKTIMLRDPLAALFPRITSDKIYFISLDKNETGMQHYYYDLKINKTISYGACGYIPVPKDTACIPVLGSCQHILNAIVTQNGLLSGFAWH